MTVRREDIYNVIVEAHRTLFIKLANEYKMPSSDVTVEQEDRLQNAALLLTHVVCEWMEQNDPSIPHWGIEP
jgi:hypothetical protein